MSSPIVDGLGEICDTFLMADDTDYFSLLEKLGPTMAAQARALGVTRQMVHNWRVRKRIPWWWKREIDRILG